MDANQPEENVNARLLRDRAEGPLTGKGSGSCMLRIHDNQKEPVQGLAGALGRPVSIGGKFQSAKEVFNMSSDKKRSNRAGKGRKGGNCWENGSLGIFNCCNDNVILYGRGNGSNKVRNPAGLICKGVLRGSTNPGAAFAPESQLETLKAQAGHLEETLHGIKRQIMELESGISKSNK